MKIGILTYHRTLNYGACLQAVATRIILEKLGHDVYYVDYWPEYHRSAYEAFSWRRFLSLGLRSRFKYMFESIKWYKYREIRIGNYELFFQRFIYPYCKSESDHFDAIVYGSDQIWRKQTALKDYNPVYFADNNFYSNKHVAFSASMGSLPSTIKDMNRIKLLVSHFDSIAVREQNLKNLLVELGYKNVKLTLDPTLLLSSLEWNDIFLDNEIYKEKYVLVYGINSVAFNMDYINLFAQKYKLKVKILSGTASSIDTDSLITTANPSKFISLIKNAECVFTSSFHGLAFSIIYHKEFFASYNGNVNRAKTLLDALDIKGRLLDNNSEIPFDFSPIDYSKVEDKLRFLKEDSIKYLKNSVQI